MVDGSNSPMADPPRSAGAPENGAQDRRAGSRFDQWTARARTTQEAAARRARNARRARLALPLFGVAILAGFLFAARNRGVDDEFAAQFDDLEEADDVLQTVQPRFTGLTEGGDRFELTAETARRAADSPDLVALDSPRAVTALDAAHGAVVTAARGLYRTEARALDLADGVEVRYGVGEDVYVLKTPRANVSLETRRVETDAGVDGAGPGGTITADRLTADEEKSELVLEGNVRMVLTQPKRDEAGETPK